MIPAAPDLKVGDTVQWRGSYGDQVARPSIVTAIVRTAESGGKYGPNVEQISWALINAGYGIVDLANGHWAYGHQIAPLLDDTD